MEDSESFSNSLDTDEMHLAERELSTFIAAVTESFAPEQVRLSAEDWPDELSITDNCLDLHLGSGGSSPLERQRGYQPGTLHPRGFLAR